MFKSVISLLVILPLTAFAKGGDGSEFFYQSAAGKHELTPSLTHVKLTTQNEGSAKIDSTSNVLGLEYEYGLTEDISVGAILSYTSGEAESGTTSVDIAGLGNINFFAKASMAAGPGLLKYGATLSLSPGDSEVESNGDTNAYTGGHSLEPYIGYEMQSSSCTYGAKLAVDIGLTDRTTSTAGAGESKESGGDSTTISLFYEHAFSGDMKLGASLDWVTTTDDKDEDTGAKSENVSPTQNLAVYMPTKMGNGTLLPALSYVFSTDDKIEGTKIDKYSGMGLQVGYRMEF